MFIWFSAISLLFLLALQLSNILVIKLNNLLFSQFVHKAQ